MSNSKIPMLCKKDGKIMYFVKETEKLSDGEYRIIFSYKCEVCGYTVNIEQASVKNKYSNGIIIKRKIFKYKNTRSS